MIKEGKLVFNDENGKTRSIPVTKLYGFATRPYLDSHCIVYTNEDGEQENILVSQETSTMVKSDVLRYINSRDYYKNH